MKRISQFIVFAVVSVAMILPVYSVTITIEEGLDFDWSVTDAINDQEATIDLNNVTAFAGFESAVPEGYHVWNNATSGSQPTSHGYFTHDDTDGEMTWDLGEPHSKLERIVVWLRSNDPFRRNFSGDFSVSSDGENFRPIASSGLQVLAAGADSQANIVTYAFDAGEVTDFRYVRFTAIPVEQPQDKIVRHSQIYEIDIITTADQ